MFSDKMLIIVFYAKLVYYYTYTQYSKLYDK